jgi:hypothetical protein
MPTPPPFSDGFPLKNDPYRSRVNSQIYASKNYYGLAFKAGYPLQASELNEIQEIFYTQSTLSTTLQGQGWTSGAPWTGVTPFSPSMISTSGTSTITAVGATGWYFIQKQEINGGIGVWVYNDAQRTLLSSYSGAAGTTGYYGFNVKPSVVYCTTLNPAGATQDRTLQDSHNMNIINGPCGADRLKLEIVGVGFTGGATGATGIWFAPLINAGLSGSSGTIRYGNNVLIKITV